MRSGVEAEYAARDLVVDLSADVAGRGRDKRNRGGPSQLSASPVRPTNGWASGSCAAELRVGNQPLVDRACRGMRAIVDAAVFGIQRRDSSSPFDHDVLVRHATALL
jgi:hypothetical protein